MALRAGVSTPAEVRSILLVFPDVSSSASGVSDSFQKPAAGWSPFGAGFVPLGLATVAGLTPPDIRVDIWDETVRGPLGEETELARTYDVIGVGGFLNHTDRLNELGDLFRRRGFLTVVGGSAVTSEPETFRDHFDVVFIGEAERTWPQFLTDLSRGVHGSEYRQVARLEMTSSPPPRWDGIDLRPYLIGSVQATRGCPFDCEFCDVVPANGRLARHKPIDRVLEEVRALERLGFTVIDFCDDNFIGDPRYARTLVKALDRLNRSFRRPVSFFANVTLNVAQDETLLALLADANFAGVFIGIETPHRESLVEAHKPQNYRHDIPSAVAKIHGYGIVVQSGLIVGFDHDDPSIFARQFELIQECGIPVPMLNLLKAPAGTKLWSRLSRERRLTRCPELRRTASVEPFTNLRPSGMSLEELLSGYLDLAARFRDWDAFERRTRRLVDQARRRPRLALLLPAKKLRLLLGMLRGIDGRARLAMFRLVVYALRRAPFMVERVVSAVAYQHREVQRLPEIRRSIQDQLRRVEAIERELPSFVVPEHVRELYRELFPDLYARAFEQLEDEDRAQGALLDAVRRFLENGHQDGELLTEILDRRIAEEGPGHLRAAAPPVRTGAWLQQLSEDILHGAEQDVRRAGGPSLGR